MKDVWRNVMPKKKHKKPTRVKGMPIAKKIMKDLLREKTITFAIMLQLFIIFTSSVLLTNASTFFDTTSIAGGDPITIALTGDSYVAQRIEPYFERSEIYAVVYPEEVTALEKFEEGDIDGILVFNTSEDYLPIYIDMIVPKGDVKASIITSSVKDALEIYENELRDRYLAEPNAIRLDRLHMTRKANPVTTQIFEALYNILIPFLLLMPGVLLGGLVIDIIIEELETKTLNLLMLIISFRRYLFEVLVSILALSMAQVVLWQYLLSIQGIVIANLPQITVLTLILNFLLFVMCILLTLAVNDKTRAQLIYSFVVILLFATAPLFSINPIRVISRLAIGLVAVPFMSYALILGAISLVLFIAMMLVVNVKEW
jgi:ABC-type Na+ efflux pump permease subunit